jgi:hypothetical protein
MPTKMSNTAVFLDAAGLAGARALYGQFEIDSQERAGSISTVQQIEPAEKVQIDKDIFIFRGEASSSLCTLSVSGIRGSALAAGEDLQVSVDGGKTWLVGNGTQSIYYSSPTPVIGTQWGASSSGMSGGSTVTVKVKVINGHGSSAVTSQQLVAVTTDQALDAIKQTVTTA